MAVTEETVPDTLDLTSLPTGVSAQLLHQLPLALNRAGLRLQIQLCNLLLLLIRFLGILQRIDQILQRSLIGLHFVHQRVVFGLLRLQIGDLCLPVLHQLLAVLQLILCRGQ